MALPARCYDLKQSKMGIVVTTLGAVFTVCTAPFNMQALGILLFLLCSSFPLTRFNWVGFVMETQNVFCEAVTEF